MTSDVSNQTLFQRRLARLDRHIQDLHALDNRYGWARLGLFLAGSVIGLTLLVNSSLVGWLALLATIVAFTAAVRQHRTVRHTLAQFQLWRTIKVGHSTRQRLDWARLPAALPSSTNKEHPFEFDLDLTGERSLCHLLDTAVSLEGGIHLRERLLTTPPDVETVTARQAIVRELVPLTYFRDRLTLDARIAMASGARRWDARQTLTWFAQPPGSPGLLRALQMTAGLAAANVILFVLNQAGLMPPLWEVSLLLYLVVYLSQAYNVVDLFQQAATLRDALAPLAEVAGILETRSYIRTPQLKRHCEAFLSGTRPSEQLRRVVWLMSAASLKNNPVLWALLNLLLPWDLFVAYRLNGFRRDLAALMPRWLDGWFELEADSALATFAVLNPTYTFPQVNTSGVFQARALGHPLIPSDSRVCNDFAMEHLGDVVLITGSNMSGKSSFLRTLGVNLCLAYAGAPVCAESLEVGLFRVFSSIRLNDSLSDGFSYFYAEVRRLRALLTALEADHPIPLFFLIDEIFRATNNQERLIGSRAYVRALIGKHGVGIISTHDLELTSLPGPLNYHFEDQVVEGQMTFDHSLRLGPSPTTNALKIMRLAGLPVGD